MLSLNQSRMFWIHLSFLNSYRLPHQWSSHDFVSINVSWVEDYNPTLGYKINFVSWIFCCCWKVSNCKDLKKCENLVYNSFFQTRKSWNQYSEQGVGILRSWHLTKNFFQSHLKTNYLIFFCHQNSIAEMRYCW